jgi:hypothetical protein
MTGQATVLGKKAVDFTYFQAIFKFQGIYKSR